MATDMTPEEMHEKYPLPDPRMRWMQDGPHALYGVHTETMFDTPWWLWWVEWTSEPGIILRCVSHKNAGNESPKDLDMPGATEEECYAFIHQHILLGIQL